MYTSGQRELMCKFEKFLNNDKTNVFQLTGGAGTGKTYCLSYFLEKHKYDYNIITTAPTHKAVQILKNNFKDNKMKTCTIHKLLGYRMVYDKNGENSSEYDFSKFGTYINSEKKTILVIDEISMIGDVLLNSIKILQKQYVCKLILTGDDCQLPAMEKKIIDNKKITYPKISEIFNYYDVAFNLTEIKRTDKKILLETYQIFRDYVLFQDYDIFLKRLNELKKIKNVNVKFVNYTEKFERYITRSYKDLSTTTNVIVASKQKVKDYNKSILTEIYPHLTCEWNINQPFYFTDYYKHSTFSTFYTSTTGLVLGVCKKNIYCDYFKNHFDVIELMLGIFDEHNNINRKIKVNVFDSKFLKQNDKIILDFKVNLKNKMREYNSKKRITDEWHEFYQNTNHVNCPIAFSYCITAYKSQGSTYDNVFVDMENILLCRRDSPLQLCRELYTAVSRTKTNLVIFLNFNDINNKKKCSRCHSIKDSEDFINKLKKEFKLCISCRLSSNKNRKSKSKSK